MAIHANGDSYNSISKTVTLDFRNGRFTKSNSDGTLFSEWVSNPDEEGAYYTLSTTANNMSNPGDGSVQLASGINSVSIYTLKISDGFVIDQLSISGTSVGANLIIEYSDPETEVIKTFTFQDGIPSQLTIDGNYKQNIVFTIMGSNSRKGSINIKATNTTDQERGCQITWHLKRNISQTEFAPFTYTYKKGYPMRPPVEWRRGYCDYEYHLNSYDGPTITSVPDEDNADIYITYRTASSCPIQFSPSINTPIYQVLRTNSTTGNTTAYRSLIYDATSTAKWATTEQTYNLSDNMLWAFTGDPYECRIWNKANPNNILKAGSATNSSTPLSWSTDTTAQTSSWALFKNTSIASESNAFALQVKMSDVYLNYNPSTNKAVSTYYGNGVHGTLVNLYTINSGTTSPARYTLLQTAPIVNVTYEVRDTSNILVDRSMPIATLQGVAPNLPNPQRRAFCTYGYDTNIIDATTTTVTTTYNVNGAPFEFSPDTDHLRFYLLRVGSGTNWNTILSSTDATYAKVGSSTDTNKSNGYQWAFVGDPYRLKIYNKWRWLNNIGPLSINKSDYNTAIGKVASTTGVWTGITPATQQAEVNTFELFKTTRTDNGSNAFVLRLHKSEDIGSSDLFLGRNSTYLELFKAPADTTKYTDTGAYKLNVTSASQGNALHFIVQSVAQATYIIARADGTKVTISNVPYSGGESPNIPTAQKRDYKKYTYYSDQTMTTVLNSMPSTDGVTVYVKETTALPFECSFMNDQSAIHWYYMRIRDIKYISAYGPGPYPCTSNTVDCDPMSQWAFEAVDGTGNNGLFRIYNRWYGSDYVLANPYGNLFPNGSTTHQINKAPIMVRKSEAEAQGWQTQWRLVQYSDRKFGFSDKDYSNVSINVYRATDALSFFYWDAKLAWNSRIELDEVHQHTIESNRSNIIATINKLIDYQGSWYAFNRDVNITKSDLDGMTTQDLYDLASDPDNYQYPIEGAFAIKSAGGGTFLSVPTSYIAPEITNVNTNPTITSSAFDSEGNVIVPSAVVRMVRTDDADAVHPHRYVVHSAGLTLKWNINKVNMTNQGHTPISIYPMGKGQVAIIATTDQTSDPWSKAIYNNGTNITVNPLGTNDNAAKWYVTPVTALKTKVFRVNLNNDYYNGKSIATMAYDFPVSLSEEDGSSHLLTASSITATDIEFRETTGTLAPGTPFIYINDNGDTDIKLKISSDVSTPITTPGSVRSLMVRTQLNDSDFITDNIRVLGQKTAPASWLPISRDSENKSSIGFRRNNSNTIAANKVYITLEGLSPEAKSRYAVFLEDASTTTNIQLPQKIKDKHIFYDLMGRKVDNPQPGIYIKNGKKVIIK